MYSRAPVALATVVTAVALALIGASGAAAWPGQIDDTYPVYATDSPIMYVHDVAVLANGQTVVAGLNATQPVVARFTATGLLDSGFNGSGAVWLGDSEANMSSPHVAVDAQNRILVAVSTPATPGATADFAVVRLLPSGAVDGSFGTNGWVHGLIGVGDGATAMPVGVALDAQGRIVVAGYESTYDPMGGWRVTAMAAARLTPSGALDTTFSGDGGMTLALDGTATAIALDTQGRLLLAADGGSGPILVRLTAAGAPDASFGSGGVATLDATALGGVMTAAALTVDASGRPVFAGTIYYGYWSDGFVARATASGALDTTFGDGGWAELGAYESTGFNHLALDAAGRPVVVGSGETELGSGFLVARFTSDGGLDEDFGWSSGYSIDSVTGADTEDARAVRVLNDGHLLVVGTSGSASIAVVRYWADWVSDVSVGAWSLSAGTLTVGAPVELAGSVWTNGPDDASGVALHFDLPPSFELVSSESDLGACTGLTCSADWLSVDDEFQQTWVTFVPRAAGPAEIRVRATSDGRDQVAENNTVTLPVTVQEAAVQPPAVQPSGAPPPKPDTTVPHVRVRVKPARLGVVLRKGLVVTVFASEPGRVRAVLSMPRKVARQYGLRVRGKSLVVASASKPSLDRLTLRFGAQVRRALARAKRVPLTLTVAVTDAAGNRGATTRGLTLRR